MTPSFVEGHMPSWHAMDNLMSFPLIEWRLWSFDWNASLAIFVLVASATVKGLPVPLYYKIIMYCHLSNNCFYFSSVRCGWNYVIDDFSK